MQREEAFEYVDKQKLAGDKLIGVCFTQLPPKFWLFALIGPIAVFAMKYYNLGVSEKGLYFCRLGILGKFTGTNDFFPFEDFESISIGSGKLQRTIKILFRNGKKLKLKAQRAGGEKVAVLTDEMQDLINAKVPERQ